MMIMMLPRTNSIVYACDLFMQDVSHSHGLYRIMQTFTLTAAYMRPMSDMHALIYKRQQEIKGDVIAPSTALLMNHHLPPTSPTHC